MFAGTFAVSPVAAAIATLVMVFAGVYLLWMYQRVVFGEAVRLPQGPRAPPDRHQPDRGADARTAVRADAACSACSRPSLLDLIQVPVDRPAGPGRRRDDRDGGGAMTTNEWLAIAPFVLVVALAMLVVIVDLVWPNRPTRRDGGRARGPHRRRRP